MTMTATTRRPVRRPACARSRALYPFAWPASVLVVPCLLGSGPGHRQTLWQGMHPERELFGGWKQAHKVHFDDGGLFDRIHAR